MRAAICPRYGPPEVLEVREVPAPVPKANELLVRVRASSVNSSDWFIRGGIPSASLTLQIPFRLMMGVCRPRRPILGLILVGEVVATGRAVARFQVGDRVWAFTKFRLGGYAQYACVPESSTVAKAPSRLTSEEAAAIPYGGLLALHFLRKGGIAPGQRVLVYGASGGVGTMAVQLARHFGAEVTGVCGPANRELVLGLGASTVLDYTQDLSPPDGARYDFVLDAVGKRKQSALRDACMRALASGGRAISVDEGTPALPAADLDALRELADAGAVQPVIDRVYPLERIAEAHAYVEEEHKRGNVVISIL